MEFVTFIEKNTKENETFVYYLQWTGNEEILTRLDRLINGASYETFYGDHSIVGLDISVKIPESSVDIHCEINETINLYHNLFTKCVGKCTLTITDEEIEKNKYEKADILDCMFYPCKITTMFE